MFLKVFNSDDENEINYFFNKNFQNDAFDLSKFFCLKFVKQLMKSEKRVIRPSCFLEISTCFQKITQH